MYSPWLPNAKYLTLDFKCFSCVREPPPEADVRCALFGLLRCLYEAGLFDFLFDLHPRLGRAELERRKEIGSLQMIRYKQKTTLMQAISFDLISPLFKYWHGGPLPVIKKQFIGIRVEANAEKGDKVERMMLERAWFMLNEAKGLHDAGLENVLFASDEEVRFDFAKLLLSNTNYVIVKSTFYS